MYNMLDYFTSIGLLKNKLLLQPNNIQDTALINMIHNHAETRLKLQGTRNKYNNGVNSDTIKIISINTADNIITDNIYKFNDNKYNLVFVVISIPLPTSK